ncbi:filamentous hemagglutinin N-terminal domain-containing protein [Hankyongella ginsenosidimutans]|uniref:Filamentous hemagglutinin N-terminal domain-containing protein n=1 Tax=Hankyongella ginsenosidimutans TaxID=1763828 RepID=A0A4D7C7E3_9SPHN|nr:filamentous hemagglutinin N-terminal domain-containing protein [Hankyongella ginsenosidimutans]
MGDVQRRARDDAGVRPEAKWRRPAGLDRPQPGGRPTEPGDRSARPEPGADPSRIAGQIKADGTVIVINQNGVIFTPTAKVNTHAAIATSLEITAPPTTDSGRAIADQLRAGSEAFLRDGLLRNDADIRRLLVGQTMTGGPAVARLGAQFTSTLGTASNNTGTLENRLEGAVTVEAGAELTTGDGGFLVLAAPAVSNAGVLQATNGSVSLVAGRDIVLRAATGASNSADPNIRGIVAYSANISEHVSREVDGEPLSSINGAFTATNTGLVQSTRGYLSIVAGVNSYQTLVRDDEGRPVLVNGTPAQRTRRALVAWSTAACCMQRPAWRATASLTWWQTGSRFQRCL